jgi:hypothetical protein
MHADEERLGIRIVSRSQRCGSAARAWVPVLEWLRLLVIASKRQGTTAVPFYTAPVTPRIACTDQWTRHVERAASPLTATPV